MMCRSSMSRRAKSLRQSKSARDRGELRQAPGDELGNPPGFRPWSKKKIPAFPLKLGCDDVDLIAESLEEYRRGDSSATGI
jgi:hypothetical protein